jgi:hypothetical protein
MRLSRHLKSGGFDDQDRLSIRFRSRLGIDDAERPAVA